MNYPIKHENNKDLRYIPLKKKKDLLYIIKMIFEGAYNKNDITLHMNHKRNN